MNIASVLHHESRRTNGRTVLTRAVAEQLASQFWMPTSFQRCVLSDLTFRFEGRAYPAPGFLPGQIVLVSPVEGSDSLNILGGVESHSDTSALSVRSHSSRHTSRAARTEMRTGRSTTGKPSPTRSGRAHRASVHEAVRARTPFRKTGNAPSARGLATYPISVQPLPVHHI